VEPPGGGGQGPATYGGTSCRRMAAPYNLTGGAAEPPVGGLQLRTILQEVRRNLLEAEGSSVKSYRRYGGTSWRRIAAP
jgi:hypothetical protein